MQVKFIPWEHDADVYGEAAGMAYGDRVLDLVVTHGNENFPWDIVDGTTRVVSGIAKNANEAKRAAETAGRREFMRLA